MVSITCSFWTCVGCNLRITQCAYKEKPGVCCTWIVHVLTLTCEQGTDMPINILTDFSLQCISLLLQLLQMKGNQIQCCDLNANNGV